jgi:hypothetical protein
MQEPACWPRAAKIRRNFPNIFIFQLSSLLLLGRRRRLELGGHFVQLGFDGLQGFVNLGLKTRCAKFRGPFLTFPLGANFDPGVNFVPWG